MTILEDDMGGLEPIDPSLAEYIMDWAKAKSAQKDNHYEIGLILHSMNSDISHLKQFEGDLSNYGSELDIMIAQLTKLAEKASK